MSFKDIKGQDSAIEMLKREITQGRLSKAYLFVGPQEIGKKKTALTLAKGLNCEAENFDPCDKCPSCIKIEKNQHPDIHLIEDAQNIKIEEVRQLKKDISLRPYEAKCKVFIIDNADNLTPEAANAMLKVLEEPPKDSLIILITAKPQVLYKTIISRCQAVKFYPLGRSALKEILKEEYQLDEALAHFLAYFCEGRFGRALRLKETDIFRDKNRAIDAFFTNDNFELNSLSGQERLEIAARLNILATYFRDIYLLKTGLPHAELVNVDRRPEILNSLQEYSFTELDEIFNSISDSLLYLRQNINTRLLLSSLKAQIWKRLS